MKPEHKQYILSNIGRKSPEAISRDLGIQERKVKRFLERHKTGKDASSSSSNISLSVGKSKIFLSIILIVALGFAVYSNSINGKFIWDDTHLVEDNLYIRDWANLPKLFTESMAAGADAPTLYSFYRPFQLITYAVDYSVWKLDPRGYHLTNILLHILASLTVFWLILTLFKDWKISLLTGLFFIVHPVHTEAVSYIAGRADSLVLMFILMSFVFYIKALNQDKRIYYVLMTASYALAVLSKELSLILPFLLLLYHYTFRKEWKLKAILPILIIHVSYIITRFTFLSFLFSNVTHKTTFTQRLAGFFIAMINYIKVMVLPLDLHMEYGNSFFNFTYPKAWLGAAVVLVLLILMFKTRQARNVVFFSIAWFLLALVPASGILYPINAYMAEHWLYLPSVGAFLLLAKGLTLLHEENGLKAVSTAAIVLFLVFYSYLTVAQNSYWKAPIPFYERTIKFANNSSRVYFNLANEYRKINNDQRAVDLYKKAIQIRPDYQDAYYNMGKSYENMHDQEKAIAAYQAVIQQDPNYDKAYYNLGNLYYESGKLQEAVDSYERTIRINPRHIKAYNNLGIAHVAIQRYEDAEALLKKAIAIDPNYAMSYGNLAIYYFGQQKYDLASEYYDKAELLGFVDPKFFRKIAPYRIKAP